MSIFVHGRNLIEEIVDRNSGQRIYKCAQCLKKIQIREAISHKCSYRKPTKSSQDQREQHKQRLNRGQTIPQKGQIARKTLIGILVKNVKQSQRYPHLQDYTAVNLYPQLTNMNQPTVIANPEIVREESVLQDQTQQQIQTPPLKRPRNPNIGYVYQFYRKLSKLLHDIERNL